MDEFNGNSSNGKYTDYDIINEYNNNNRIHQNKKRVGVIAGIAITVLIISIVIVPQYATDNKRALDLFDKARESMYADDKKYLTVSTLSEQYIDEAQEIAKSAFVRSDTRQKISDLSSIIKQTKALEEAENNVVDNDFKSAQSNINLITLNDLKKDDRYVFVTHKLELNNLKLKNKSRTEKMLEDMMKNDYPGIVQKHGSSLRKIQGICGIATFDRETKGDSFSVNITTYTGKVYKVLFIYSTNNQQPKWDENIKKLSDLTQKNEEFEIAAIIGTDYLNEVVCVMYNNYDER